MSMQQFARLALVASIGVGLAGLARGEDPPIADDPIRPDLHLGVASCAGSPCHGNAAAVGQVVLQNEHTTWVRHDAHARAFLVLEESRSQRIARNLGIADPTRAEVCLDCHADNVPAARRGPRFQLEDGVGCEACHGGAGRWIDAHLAGPDRETLVGLGLVPLDDPVTRAERCVSCHLGDDDRFVSHRIMGAGHPRLSFELDTFSVVQPAHHRVDDDYRTRGKRVAAPAVLWAVGQAVSARESLRGLMDPSRSRDGVWPEFVFYDCHACHHPMSVTRWAPRPSTGLGGHPGVARLNDANLLMLRQVLAVVSPDLEAELARATLRLHAAVSRGEGTPSAAAARLLPLVERAEKVLARWRPGGEELRRITRRLVAAGRAGEFGDYAGSEQATMAVQSLAASLHALERLAPGDVARLNDDLRALLAATEDDDRFVPQSVPPILERVRRRLPNPVADPPQDG